MAVDRNIKRTRQQADFLVSTMARTAKTASKTRLTATVNEKPATYPVNLIKSTLLVMALASASLATQLALRPLYGGTVLSLNHSKVELLACLLSALFPINPTGLSERFMLLGLASWFGYAPYAGYAVGVWTTKWKNPALGSSVAEAVILLPIICTGILLVRQWSVRATFSAYQYVPTPPPLQRRFFRFLPGPMTLKAVGALGSFNCLNVLEQWLWTHLPLGGQVHSSNIVRTFITPCRSRAMTRAQ